MGSPVGGKITEAMTRVVPMTRIAQPEDYPGTIAFLLSDDAGYLTGQTIRLRRPDHVMMKTRAMPVAR